MASKTITNDNGHNAYQLLPQNFTVTIN